MAIDPYNTSPRDEPWDAQAEEALRPVEVVMPRPNPDVSVRAYQSSERKAQHERVEAYMKMRGPLGAIADEVDAYFNNDPPIMWRRFAEMRHKGILKLHPLGLERDTRLGHAARVHVWVPPEERVIPVIKRISQKELLTAAQAVIAAQDAKDIEALRAAMRSLRAVLN